MFRKMCLVSLFLSCSSVSAQVGVDVHPFVGYYSGFGTGLLEAPSLQHGTIAVPYFVGLRPRDGYTTGFLVGKSLVWRLSFDAGITFVPGDSGAVFFDEFEQGQISRSFSITGGNGYLFDGAFRFRLPGIWRLEPFASISGGGQTTTSLLASGRYIGQIQGEGRASLFPNANKFLTRDVSTGYLGVGGGTSIWINRSWGLRATLRRRILFDDLVPTPRRETPWVTDFTFGPVYRF